MSGSGVQFGDTTLTKVFVGGLAWETQKEAMRDHFQQFGEILEAVIISDKLTGRSKGYGFVTFKDAEAAQKACEDAAPVINGRRANCNLASLGARRQKHNAAPSPPRQVGPRSTSAAPASHVQWYYPPASPHHRHQHHHQAVFFYGYSPAYIGPDVSYNHELSYGGGSCVYPGQAMLGANALMPMYPLYQFHHQSHSMGLPAHVFAPGPMATGPALITKPVSVPPNPVCLAVE